MNCKPGDLAVIVRLDSPNYGKFVTVKEPYDGRLSEHGSQYKDSGYFMWIVDGGGLVIPGGKHVGKPVSWHAVADRYLRPLRDSDGEDETLTWAGKPADRDSDGEDETLTWAGKPADVVAHGPMVPAGSIKALPLIGGGHTPTVEGGGAYSLGGRTA